MMKRKLLVLVVASLMALANDNAKVYVIVFVNVTDEVGYQEYRDKTAAAFAEIGGHLDREFDMYPKTQSSIGEIGPFNRAFMIWYDTEEGANRVFTHETIQKHLPKMHASVSGAAFFSGRVVPSELGPVGEKYVVKLSFLKPGVDRREMDAEADRINKYLGKYGFSVERNFATVAGQGMDPRPDVISVLVYKDASKQSLLMADEQAMADISAFNTKYLDGFVYLSGVPRPQAAGQP